MTDRTDKPASSKACINETSRRCRRVLNDDFKTKVALEALKEERTLNSGGGAGLRRRDESRAEDVLVSSEGLRREQDQEEGQGRERVLPDLRGCASGTRGWVRGLRLVMVAESGPSQKFFPLRSIVSRLESKKELLEHSARLQFCLILSK